MGEVSSKFANGSCQPYRRETFRAAALAAGATFHEFTETTDNQTDNMPELIEWLRTLPLPCGIMAFNDIRALSVIDACHLARLTVPGQIQIVGVDNEVEICENTYPTLTSVLPDFEGGGYMAAQWLDEILGRGVGETLCRERLDRVSRLLRETDRTILDICFDSGFRSPSYPTALFKKTYGMTMSEWRGHGSAR